MKKYTVLIMLIGIFIMYISYVSLDKKKINSTIPAALVVEHIDEKNSSKEVIVEDSSHVVTETIPPEMYAEMNMSEEENLTVQSHEEIGMELNETYEALLPPIHEEVIEESNEAFEHLDDSVIDKNMELGEEELNRDENNEVILQIEEYSNEEIEAEEELPTIEETD